MLSYKGKALIAPLLLLFILFIPVYADTTYEAPDYLLNIWQILLAFIVGSFGYFAKLYWGKAHLCDDGSAEVYLGRFKKSIYALIAILILEAITTYIRITFM